MNFNYTILIYLILAVIFTWLAYQYCQQKITIKYLTAKLKELAVNYQDLAAQNIESIKREEQLNCKNEALKQIIDNTEAIKTEAQAGAREALFELGSELSKQLIDLHKRENQEIREISEKNISSKVDKFNSEFEKIVAILGGMGKEIEQSKSVVDLIKQSLLSPLGAGTLAEITLENILKSSGLRNNLDYVLQYNLITQDNVRLRPDALVFLPGGNLMVIDAKASKFLTEEGSVDEQKNGLSKTMSAHLKSLSSKEYAEHAVAFLQNKSENFGHQITLMFLPTEQAIEKIMAADHSFMHRAWSANIFPVGPCGLMNMLSLAKFQISDNKRLENHQIIIEEVRKLLISVGVLAQHAQKLGNNIQSLAANYDKFAGSFNHNFLAKTKTIENLGVNLSNKNMAHDLDRLQVISSKIAISQNDSAE